MELPKLTLANDAEDLRFTLHGVSLLLALLASSVLCLTNSACGSSTSPNRAVSGFGWAWAGADLDAPASCLEFGAGFSESSSLCSEANFDSWEGYSLCRCALPPQNPSHPQPYSLHPLLFRLINAVPPCWNYSYVTRKWWIYL
jgi:hypothetical protein